MKQDLYLDPDFTVEGSDFVFKADDDDNKDYIVRVTKDDFKAFTGLENECHVDFFGKKESEHQNIHEACQQIVDGYQIGANGYDVEIKRTNVSQTVWTKSKTYQIQTGDILTSRKNRKTYQQVRGGFLIGSIPFDIVNGWKEHLKETNPYPLTFEVI
jgi:hypothetical protein